MKASIPAAAEPPALSFELSLARPSGFRLEAAATLPARGLTVLFGPSGCGKTTLLRALAGLERACGRVALGEHVWQDDALGRWLPPHRRPAGCVIQDSALFPHLSVEGNLAYAARRAEQPWPAEAMAAMAARLGLQPLMARRPATLSGGERQRVAIARALATRPRLLLLDEPLAAVDAAHRAQLLPWLAALPATEGLPVVMVTHSVQEAARLADLLVVMRAGRIQARGDAAALMLQADFPLAGAEEAGALLQAQVLGHDDADGLSRLSLRHGAEPADPGPGAIVWMPRLAVPPGSTVRLRVAARDVALALAPVADSSVLNQWPARVLALAPEAGDAGAWRVTLALAPDGARLLARLTARSVRQLGLAPGRAVVAMVKGVALG